MDENANDLIAGDIEDGSYFVSARTWYSELFHTPVAERSYYMVLIVLSIISAYYAINSFMGIFPIATRVPFVTYSQDVLQDLPRMQRITNFKGEDGNIALMRYLVENYVVNRESYELNKYELRYRSVWSQSENDVFEQYKAAMDTSNPYSPYRLYTNRAYASVYMNKQDPNLFKYEPVQNGYVAHVLFIVTVYSTDGQELSHSNRRADIAYTYTPYVVDQSLSSHVWIARLFHLTGDTLKASGVNSKVTPMTFKVSDYQVKELLE